MLSQSFFRWQRLQVLIVIAFFLFHTPSRGATVLLEWGPVANAAGYKVFYGGASGVYTTTIDAGLNTTATVTGLTEGQTYYFAAVSYDTNGVTSGYTPELVDSLTGPPSITGQPANQSVASGATATFSAAVSGNAPLSYQWYEGSTAIAGATNAVLALENVSSGNAGSYKVTVVNSLGSITSAGATLTVSAAGAVGGVLPPTFTLQPSSQTVLGGAAVTVMALVSGASQEQWYFNGTPVAGATSGVLLLAGVTSANAGNYYLVAQNSGGSVTSSIVVVTVLTAPAILTQPAGGTVVSGSIIIFGVTATGGSLAYQWRDNGAAISGATSATLTLASVATANAGSYSVVVSNSLGSVTSSAASLVVTVPVPLPVFLSQPGSQSVSAGATVNLMALETGATQEQWYHNGVAVAGATTSVLTLTGVTSASAGSYDLVAGNSGGSVTSSVAALTVLSAPVITTQPAGGTVVAGSTITFGVTATGGSLVYQWRDNGTAISGATSTTLTLASVATTNAGSYSVVVSNSLGSVTSSAAPLVVTVPVPLPTFLSQPGSQSVSAGATVNLMALETGATQEQWYHNGAAVAGATTSVLTLTGVTSASAGSYDLVAGNSGGSITSSVATLTVISAVVPPTFTQQPVSQTFAVGANATFTALGTGTAPFQDQWYFNGQQISGANSNVLNIGNVVASEAGSYYLVVANSAGTITSSVATLTVIAPPVISTQPLSQAVAAGANATLSVAASGSGVMSYQWYFNGTAISGATSSTYAVTGMTSAKAGGYFVIVGDLAGSVTSAAATLSEGSVAAQAGTYNGLFYQTRGSAPAIAVSTAGLLGNCMVGTNGVYSGKIYLGGTSYSLAGTFNSTGASSAVVTVAANSNLTVNMQMDLSGVSQQITGTVSNMNATNPWVSTLVADLATNAPSVPAGSFMMNLPAANSALASSPHGYASVISAGGQVTLMGLLFDGTMISQSVPLSQNGSIPVYFPLYNGRGLIEGWVNLAGGQPTGTVTWIRPSGITTANPYPAGFTNSVSVN